MDLLTNLASKFPHLRHIDMGGGLGIVEHPYHEELDLKAMGESIAELRSRLDPQLNEKIQLWIEPGRYFVATSCVLLTRVTQIKAKHDWHYIGPSFSSSFFVDHRLIDSSRSL